VSAFLSRRVTPSGCLLLVVIVLLCPKAVFAESEGQLWLRGGLRAAPVEKLELEYFQDLRSPLDFSTTPRWMHTAAVGYRPIKWLDLGAGYRFDPLFPEEEGCCGHRVFGAVELLPKVGSLRLGLRQRVQSTFKPERTKSVFRSRMKASWKLSKSFRPYTAAEAFIRFGDDKSGYEKTRVSLGLAWRLKALRLKPFYALELPTTNDPTVHVAGLSFRYTFN